MITLWAEYVWYRGVRDANAVLRLPLFITQGCQGIEFGGGIGRQQAGESGDGGKGDDRHYKSEGVARLQTEQQRFSGMRRGKRQTSANHQESGNWFRKLRV